MSREAQFSINYDGNESGNADAVLNAGSDRGFIVDAVEIKWQPHSMSSSSDELPYLATARYTGSASGGDAGTVFNHTDGVTAATSARLAPTTLGTGAIIGLQYFPGSASYTGSSWYLHGGEYLADFNGFPIEIAKNNSLWVRVANVASVTIYFTENIVP